MTWIYGKTEAAYSQGVKRFLIGDRVVACEQESIAYIAHHESVLQGAKGPTGCEQNNKKNR